MIQISAHEHYIPTIPEIFQECFGIVTICVAVYSVNHCFLLEILLLGCYVIVVPWFLNISN